MTFHTSDKIGFVDNQERKKKQTFIIVELFYLTMLRKSGSFFFRFCRP